MLMCRGGSFWFQARPHSWCFFSSLSLFSVIGSVGCSHESALACDVLSGFAVDIRKSGPRVFPRSDPRVIFRSLYLMFCLLYILSLMVCRKVTRQGDGILRSAVMSGRLPPTALSWCVRIWMTISSTKCSRRCGQIWMKFITAPLF